MRLLVAGAFEAGSHFAHAINTVEMAHAFASLGHDVALACLRPSDGRREPRALAEGYGLEAPVRWIQLPPRLLRRRLGDNARFAAAALAAALARAGRPDLVYARNYALPWLTSRLGIPTAAESHAHPGNRSPGFERLVRAARLRGFRLWVTISPRLAEHYALRGVPARKLAVLPDAVQVRRFARPAALPPSPYAGPRPRVVYAGHLYDYKGIPAILAAAARLPAVAFHLVGGWPADVEATRRRAREGGVANVTVHGAVPHAEVPRYLWYADALLLPPSARHASAAWTSPLKLGEYLASGTPVVATGIPALRDLVSEAEVRFVAPDDGEALARGISGLLESPDAARALARAGAVRAQELSYLRRARAVLERVGDAGSPVPLSALGRA